MKAWAIKTRRGYIGYSQYSKSLIKAKLYATKKEAEEVGGGYQKEFDDNRLVPVEIKEITKRKKTK